jgi:hypothetical protein
VLPQIAYGGDVLQIWKVAANILNKQSRTADRGWSSSLGIRWGAKNPQCKTSNLLHIIIKSLGQGFGGKARAKEATWENMAQVEGWDQNGP